ncbi:MAG: 2Fe-2S iron-sulfur cluster-binding protein [Candidatus Kapabacteria bacterium]|nr:2Fe-2S iron-sulfur cluster-binding protein [Candidatus Kapabacteria bacterium]MCS7301947.1 2Fe-2S iron-sulfur cluster-binding protein [Candidatus Kapabacteria bacterium]MCX7936597.1 2Fe-2S iron-sulfur cluster-binding protein [Chlorobiota bacterium]
MPTITIDGRKIETQPGKTIIEAALDNGIVIPHFCWHPALSVAGNCRMCLVRVGSYKKAADGSLERDSEGNPVVQWLPKLQIACATPVSDGMVVDTKGEKTVAAQNAVMEFLLINHPLDCPICDEAGQCKLQEYAFKHSRGESRFTEEKVHKPKRIRWSDRIVFDGERCILCSRCIRFANEIAKQPVLTFVERNDHVTIELFEGTQFDSPYSMNVIELCPVGALTSADFRFKARVWDMSFTPSVCPGCARGCNIHIGVRDNQILRLEPRPNPHVNQYWMCDAGRLEQYQWVNTGRISGAWLRQNGRHVSVPIDEALDSAAELLKRHGKQSMMILSGSITNEDAFVARQFAEAFGVREMAYVTVEDPSFGDDFLRCSDRNANSTGLRTIGIEGNAWQQLLERVQQYSPELIYFVGADPLTAGHNEWTAVLEKVPTIIAQLSNHSSLEAYAEIVLPAATYAEIEGTFTNIDGWVQYLQPALETKETLRINGMKQSRLDKFGAPNDRWTHGERRLCRPHWKLMTEIASRAGHQWSYRTARDVFAALSDTVTQFQGMTYEALIEYRGIRLSSPPEPVGVVYESHYMRPQAE